MRISIALMTAIIALTGISLGCLLYASSPWAITARLIFCAALGVSPLIAAYRRGSLQAFTLGFAVWAWGYLLLTALPSDDGPKTLVTIVLDWSYSRIIADERQSELSSFKVVTIRAADTVYGQEFDNLGNRVDIFVDGSPILEGITTITNTNPSSVPTLKVFMHHSKTWLLTQAISEGKKLRISRHRGLVDLPATVDRASFDKVGKTVLGLLLGLIGGLLGIRFYRTRET